MTETKDKSTKDAPEQRHVSGLHPGDPLAGYVSPDLSWSQDAGTPPPEEQEWNDARTTAQEEDHDRVEDAEAEAVATRQKEAEEQAEKDAEARTAALQHQAAVEGAIAGTPTGKAASEKAAASKST